MQPTNPYAPPRYDQPSTGYAPGSGGGHYEFTPPEEAIIRDLAGAIRFVGTFSIVLAVVLLLASLVALFAAPPFGIACAIEGVVVFLVGLWSNGAARSFRLVTDDQGNDIPHLVGALFDLRRVYNLVRVLLVLTSIFVVAATAIAVIVAPRLSAR